MFVRTLTVGGTRCINSVAVEIGCHFVTGHSFLGTVSCTSCVTLVQVLHETLLHRRLSFAMKVKMPVYTLGVKKGQRSPWIIFDEDVDDDEDIHAVSTLLSEQLPQSNSYIELYNGSDSQQSMHSSSCPPELPAVPSHHGGRQRQEAPPFMTADEARSWAKERQKKDNHNQSK